MDMRITYYLLAPPSLDIIDKYEGDSPDDALLYFSIRKALPEEKIIEIYRIYEKAEYDMLKKSPPKSR